ncbi:LysR family transcriptional regulator [Pseudomonas aeruginosa]|uniref:LysR family transcriptional regulator n=1 Tax=Pseudomonas aeruginosa TaxID=287 RepID=UPI001F5FDF2E|nr:LysR family transcriptional regulator [Pseudomonas aeruginosa]
MNGTEFEQITAFLAAVEHGGFTAAGQALGRDGSILSRRVTALEKRLGVRLMERTTRRLALTEAGEAFHQRMRGALQALAGDRAGHRSSGDRRAWHAAHRLARNLRPDVGCPRSFPPSWPPIPIWSWKRPSRIVMSI